MTTATAISYDARKFEELLLFIAEESVDDPNFGKTKLNKVLYYVDFLAYGAFGQPVTGAEYQRRPYGPVPRQITEARQRLVARGDAVVEVLERFGRRQERLTPRRSADRSMFTEDEQHLVVDVIKQLWDKSAVEASDISHRELGWKLAKDRETIPYSTVFLSGEPITDDDVRRAREVYRFLQEQVA